MASRVIRNLVYPLWARRDHPAYARYASEFARTQFLSADALEEYRFGLLRDQLLHAFRHIPFYRRRFEQIGVTPLDLKSVADLRLLPVLTKRDIQDSGAEILADNVPASLREQNQTGGSTGTPLQFWVDRERFDSRRASTDRHNSWAGLEPGDWHAHLWGSRFDVGTVTRPHITWRQRLLYRNLALNTSLISDEDLAAYVNLVRAVRPRVMLAYAQSAVMFARYCQSQGVKDIRFESMITTAEMLLPGQRTLLESVFGGEVFNRYGSREFSVIASECEAHAGMHINADSLIVEVEPVPDMEPGIGRVLVTDLRNRSMPLIRYAIGDFACPLETETCRCGRALPRIAEIQGRVTDFLVTGDDRRISGISLALLAGDMPEVRQMQFVQRDRQMIQLRIVPGEGYGIGTLVELRRRMEPYLRGTTELAIVAVDRIASEASGKFRYVKSAEDAGEPAAYPAA